MFRVGDEVVCVDARPQSSPVYGLNGARTWTAVRKGDVYIVGGLGVAWDGRTPVVYLVGHENPDPFRNDCGYGCFRFRKVQRRDLSAWLETATDFEEPKRTPAKKRERA